MADEKIKKSNVDSGTTSAESSPAPQVKLTVTDGSGEEREARVRPDDAALLAQRAEASHADDPINTGKGHGSNPDLAEATEEEKAADAKAYAERVS